MLNEQWGSLSRHPSGVTAVVAQARALCSQPSSLANAARLRFPFSCSEWHLAGLQIKHRVPGSLSSSASRPHSCGALGITTTKIPAETVLRCGTKIWPGIHSTLSHTQKSRRNTVSAHSHPNTNSLMQFTKCYLLASRQQGDYLTERDTALKCKLPDCWLMKKSGGLTQFESAFPEDFQHLVCSAQLTTCVISGTEASYDLGYACSKHCTNVQ